MYKNDVLMTKNISQSENDPSGSIRRQSSAEISKRFVTKPNYFPEYLAESTILPNEAFRKTINTTDLHECHTSYTTWIESRFKQETSLLDNKEVFGLVAGSSIILLTQIAVGVDSSLRKAEFSSKVYLLEKALYKVHRLALCDLALILHTFSGVFFIKLVLNRKPTEKFVFLGQHTLQTLLFLMSVLFTLKFDFFWVQTWALYFHTCVLFMKMHSYISSNLEFLEEDMNTQTRDKSNTTSPSISRTRNVDNTSVKQAKLEFPRNVTLFNYFQFLCYPTLVYTLNYPKTKTIRISYVIEKLIGVFCSMAIVYYMIVQYIEPAILIHKEVPFISTTLQLMIPVLTCNITLFYLVFESLLNAVAELTRFADRRFYGDWWNCTSFDEFARKWNRPVHEFLFCHVYARSRRRYRFGKRKAALITFFFSALLHELCLSLLSRSVRLYFFFFQMSQIPLITLSERARGTKVGHLGFWFSVTFGPALIILLYVKEQRYFNFAKLLFH